MPAPTQARRKARRAELTAALVVALQTLLQDGGSWSALPLDQLRRQAGVARSTFYTYFEDKGDVLLAMAEEAVADLEEHLQPWLALPDAAGPADLEEAVVVFVRGYLPHSVVIGALMEASAADLRVREFLTDRVERLTGLLEAHLSDGRRRGLVRPDVDPRLAAAWIAGLLAEGFHRLLSGPAPAEADQAAQSLGVLLWRAVYR